MTATGNDVKGGRAKADNADVLWGPENVEDAEPAPESSPNNKDSLDREFDQYQTDQEIMQQKETRQKAEIHRGTRSQYSPAVKKWRQRQ